jgi:hypothetical protein
MASSEKDVTNGFVVQITEANTESDECVTYTIRTAVRSATGTAFTARRRYNQFLQLHEELLKASPLTGSNEAIRCNKARGVVPLLPPKLPFQNNRATSFIEQRRADLESYLVALVKQHEFANNPDVQSFLCMESISFRESGVGQLSEFQWMKRTQAPCGRGSSGGRRRAPGASRKSAGGGPCVLL